MLAISLVVIGILLRFVPHAPNFTPVAAIALFSGVYLNKKYSWSIPLLLMIASDVFLGLHNVIAFTWGSFVLTGVLGMWLRPRKNPFYISAGALISSLLFFVISNFGVWLMGWYPHTTQGFIQCYVMALPFLRNFTAATLLYAAVFFGAYELIARSVKNTKFARVLLTR